MRKQASARPSIPTAGEGKRGETGHIGYLLRQACTAYRIRMEKTLAGLGVVTSRNKLGALSQAI